ncbi:MAG: lysophospholipid acyltransferase family protein [Planctomycetota bacterium]
MSGRARPPFGWRHAPAPYPERLSDQVGRAMTRMMLRFWIGAEHVGREHIPRRGPAILVANHPTLGDPFTVAFGTRRWVTWLAMEEALDWPLAGWIMRLYRVIPLDLERAGVRSIRTAYATLARGRLLGVFCEGERSQGLGLNDPIKSGAARMALRAGVPLVPVSVAGARRGWPLGSYPRRGKVVVRYHPPLDPRSFRPDLPRRERGALLTQALAEAIASGLPPAGRPRFQRPWR